MGQSNGDYRTRRDGDWNRSNTWQEYRMGSWQNAINYPGENSAAGTVTIRNGHAVTLNVSPGFEIAALEIDADDESAAYMIEGAIDNNAGTTALVGTITKTAWEDQAAWDATAEADNTNDALVIKVTGEASKTIRWVAKVEIVQVNG